MARTPSTVVSPSGRPHALAGVFAMLAPHMAALDQFLQVQLAAFEPEIREMVAYCMGTSGKRIRPALVFLSGWKDAGPVSPELVRAAAVVELVHLATLVHDDIMDSAELRRSRPTAMREFGPTEAVLLGDALFAHALHLAAHFPTTEVCAAVSESTRRVCAGEIVQSLRRHSTDLTPAEYQRIIDLKTAELFRVSCFLGARLAGSEEGYVYASDRFGRHLGIAYQIYDDLADFFGREDAIGKTLGTDLAGGKLTLPLFALMEKLPAFERGALNDEIRGLSPARPELRLKQMLELGVFDAVESAVRGEISAARAALAEWPGHLPAQHLLALSDVLLAQVAALRPTA
jgi:octaprenyl-diphosphate synthase